MPLADKFFISAGIEERQIKMDDGTVEVVWFKHLPNTDFERYAIWRSSEDERVVSSAPARLLSLGVCEPDGQPALTFAQAELIKRPVMQRMVTALLEVNGYGKEGDAGKALPPGTSDGSGTSSP